MHVRSQGASMKTAGTLRLKLAFHLSTELYTFKIYNENQWTTGLQFLVTLHRSLTWSKSACGLSAGVWEQSLFLCICLVPVRGQGLSKGVSIQLQTKLPTLSTWNAWAPDRVKTLNWDTPDCLIKVPTTLLPSSTSAAASSPLQAEVFQVYQVCAIRQAEAPVLWAKGATSALVTQLYTNVIWVPIQVERPHTNKNRSLQLTPTGIHAQQAQKVSTPEHY